MFITIALTFACMIFATSTSVTLAMTLISALIAACIPSSDRDGQAAP